MDDINILSLIDIIRGIFYGKYFKKQLIISTHDYKVAELFRRTFRNLNVEIIKYDSYTDEGPIVKQFEKFLQLKVNNQ
jgi:exonuclease SbcC